VHIRLQAGAHGSDRQGSTGPRPSDGLSQGPSSHPVVIGSPDGSASLAAPSAATLAAAAAAPASDGADAAQVWLQTIVHLTCAVCLTPTLLTVMTPRLHCPCYTFVIVSAELTLCTPWLQPSDLVWLCLLSLSWEPLIVTLPSRMLSGHSVYTDAAHPGCSRLVRLVLPTTTTTRRCHRCCRSRTRHPTGMCLR